MSADKMSKIPIIYSESYYVNIGDHIFPTSKYRLIRKKLDTDGALSGRFEFVLPERARDEEIALVHTREYINKLKSCTLSQEEILRLELPLSPEMVEASFISCGGTVVAARKALERKAAVHLGGGFHHAFPDHGEGFCVFNDVAVSIRVLQKEKVVKKAIIVDCDLHQGNGTAYIFKGDDDVYTFSMHQENNYPFEKPKSSMDIGLRNYTGDKEYLRHLKDNIPGIISLLKPDLMVYVAGADPYKEDQLGGLALTREGLRERDNFVYTQARNFDIPVVTVLGGGYAFNREDTVNIHYATIEECIRVFSS